MPEPRLLFHRDFRGYTGGHGKVWDYFNHALALGLDARVHLTPASRRGPDNPWMALPRRIEPDWAPQRADLLFVAGMDWQALPTAIDHPPVINLLQHVRHAVHDPALPLRGFLRRPAWRICVSRAVADAVVATGEVNGPVRVIPAATDVTPVEGPSHRDGGRIFVAALKQPALGRDVAGRLRAAGHDVELAEGWMERAQFLSALRAATVAVLLPHATEGFFLPGLEAMALGCAVVMPGCLGNTEYATDGVNCLMPPARPDALVAATIELLDADRRAPLVAAGIAMARRHAPDAERRAFAKLLEEMADAGIDRARRA